MTCPAWATDPIRVLFIGNSFTLQHDMPSLVAELARQSGQPITPITVAQNGAFVADTVPDRFAALELVHNHDPDRIVVQEHSTAAFQGDDTWKSLSALMRFRFLRAHVVYFAPWPRAPGHVYYRTKNAPRSPQEMVEGSETHLRKAATLDGPPRTGAVAPVGRAWLQGAELPLHAADGYHASLTGAWLTALVLARTLGFALENPQLPQRVTEPGRLARIARAVAP
jgi:hypothetical protein